MIKIAVVNNKGGIGKSALAANVGICLSRLNPFWVQPVETQKPERPLTFKEQRRKFYEANRHIKNRTIFLDLDPQCSLSRNFGFSLDYCQCNEGLAEVLKGEMPLKDVILNVDYKIRFPLPIEEYKYGFVTNDPSLLLDQTTPFMGIPNKEYKLADELNSISSMYDIAMLDCPPNLEHMTQNALNAADFVLIPVEADIDSFDGLGLVVSVIKQIQKTSNPKLKILGVAVSKHTGRTVLSRDCIEEFKKITAEYNISLFNTFIRESVSVREAKSQHVGVIDYDESSIGAKDYKSLTNEIYEAIKEGLNL